MADAVINAQGQLVNPTTGLPVILNPNTGTYIYLESQEGQYAAKHGFDTQPQLVKTWESYVAQQYAQGARLGQDIEGNYYYVGAGGQILGGANQRIAQINQLEGSSGQYWRNLIGSATPEEAWAPIQAERDARSEAANRAYDAAIRYGDTKAAEELGISKERLAQIIEKTAASKGYETSGFQPRAINDVVRGGKVAGAVDFRETLTTTPQGSNIPTAGSPKLVFTTGAGAQVMRTFDQTTGGYNETTLRAPTGTTSTLLVPNVASLPAAQTEQFKSQARQANIDYLSLGLGIPQSSAATLLGKTGGANYEAQASAGLEKLQKTGQAYIPGFGSYALNLTAPTAPSSADFLKAEAEFAKAHPEGGFTSTTGEFYAFDTKEQPGAKLYALALEQEKAAKEAAFVKQYPYGYEKKTGELVGFSFKETTTPAVEATAPGQAGYIVGQEKFINTRLEETQAGIENIGIGDFKPLKGIVESGERLSNTFQSSQQKTSQFIAERSVQEQERQEKLGNPAAATFLKTSFGLMQGTTELAYGVASGIGQLPKFVVQTPRLVPGAITGTLKVAATSASAITHQEEQAYYQKEVFTPSVAKVAASLEPYNIGVAVGTGLATEGLFAGGRAAIRSLTAPPQTFGEIAEANVVPKERQFVAANTRIERAEGGKIIVDTQAYKGGKVEASGTFTYDVKSGKLAAVRANEISSAGSVSSVGLVQPANLQVYVPQGYPGGPSLSLPLEGVPSATSSIPQVLYSPFGSIKPQLIETAGAEAPVASTLQLSPEVRALIAQKSAQATPWQTKLAQLTGQPSVEYPYEIQDLYVGHAVSPGAKSVGLVYEVGKGQDLNLFTVEQKTATAAGLSAKKFFVSLDTTGASQAFNEPVMLEAGGSVEVIGGSGVVQAQRILLTQAQKADIAYKIVSQLQKTEQAAVPSSSAPAGATITTMEKVEQPKPLMAVQIITETKMAPSSSIEQVPQLSIGPTQKFQPLQAQATPAVQLVKVPSLPKEAQTNLELTKVGNAGLLKTSEVMLEKAATSDLLKASESTLEKTTTAPAELLKTSETMLEKTATRELLRTMTPTTPVFKTPNPQRPPTPIIAQKAKLALSSRRRKGAPIQTIKIEGVRSMYADLASVEYSRAKYGKATSPSLIKRPQLWKLEGGRVPTAEQLEAKKARPKARGPQLGKAVPSFGKSSKGLKI